MSEPKLISPMLDNFAMGEPISNHNGVRSCPAMPNDSDKKYIVKIISIPATQMQLEALLLTGAYHSEASALTYFKDLSDGIVKEAETLQSLSQLEGFVPFENWQLVPMEKEVGYDVYLLSPYRKTLNRFLRRHTMTHLGAVNLGLDLCAAMAVCRRAGFLYVDLKPSNIFISDKQEYRVGDLGFISLASLKYASLPDRYRSIYTPPEIVDALASLNSTMDTYAIGLILYQVFNDGKLPFEDSPPAEPLDAPLYADYEMSEIILKACAPDPKDRWEDPIAMGQALVSYMQRNAVNDTPIVPPAAPADEAPSPSSDTPVEDTPPVGNEASDSAHSNLSAEDAQDDDDVLLKGILSEIGSEDPSFSEEPESSSEAPKADVSVLTEEELADLAFLDEMASDDTAPNEDSAKDIAYQDLSDETSDMLAQIDELILHPAPEPVVQPEPIDVPFPPPIEPESKQEDGALDTEEAEETEEIEDTSSENADSQESDAEATVPLEDEAEDDEADFDPEDPKKQASLKGWVAAFVSLLVIGCLLYCSYYFYQNYYLQPIHDMTLTGTENNLTVSVISDIDETLLTVVCTDTYGNTLTSPISNGKASFEELKPDTIYKVSIEIDGFHKLTGSFSGTYTTPPQTNIISFNAIAGSEDGSVILSFTVDGPETDGWQIVYGTEGEDEKTLSFTEHMITVTGLTVGKTYHFTLTSPSQLYIVGQYELDYTASALVYAENLTIDSCSGGSLSASWDFPEGAEVTNWTVRCYNEDGFDETITVQEPKAVFKNIDCSAAYTVEVIAEGMTKSTRAYVSENSLTVSNVRIDTSVPGRMDIYWDYDGAAHIDGWLLLYTINGSEHQEVIRCEENAATLLPVVPGSVYDFVLQAANGSTVFGSTFSQATPQASEFSGYRVTGSNMDFRMCRTPSVSDWDRHDLEKSDYTTEFSVGDKASFLVYLNRSYNPSSDTIVSLFVIRDESGNIVSTASQSRTWSEMWHGGYCEIDIPALPDTPGSYTMEIYFNGRTAGEKSFTITE